MKLCSASSSQVLRMSAFTPNTSCRTTTAGAGKAFGRAIYALNAPSRPSMVMRSSIVFYSDDDVHLAPHRCRQDRRRAHSPSEAGAPGGTHRANKGLVQHCTLSIKGHGCGSLLDK